MTLQKFEYIRSSALLKACRGIACTNCGRDDGTVCAAHSNQAKHGKGRSIKASDIYVASLCFACHSALDQGSHLSRDEREALWDVCHARTVTELVLIGEWPAGLPIPAMEVPA